MATAPQSEQIPVTYHQYHVDAQLLSADLTRPLVRKIEAQAFASLEGENDHYSFQKAEPYNANGLISFKSGYTRVSGSKSKDHGWVTLATAVVEGLNILDVITADRIVAQASTDHPLYDGHVPSVTFLGTRFENLRIGGHHVDTKMVLDICGTKPADDALYSEDTGFLDRIEQQAKDIASLGLPSTLAAQYNNQLNYIGNVRRHSGTYGPGYESTLKCSLVKSSAATLPTKSFGHMLQIPDFGLVELGVLEVEQTWSEDGGDPPGGVTTYFDLTMLEITMGSIAEGTIQVANVGTNGHSHP
jgi:hypothetical protein